MPRPALLRSVGFTFGVLVLGCNAADRPSAAGSTADAAPSVAALTSTDTLNFSAQQDSSIRVGTPNQNYGTDASLDINRTLVQFDQSALRAAVGAQDFVTAARVELTLTNNNERKKVAGRTANMHRLTQAWTELGATWNCAVDSNTSNRKADCSGTADWSMVLQPNPWVEPPSASATITPTQTGVVSFDVTADVRGFLSGAFANDGWLVKSPTAGEFVVFASREGGAPPRLVLTVRRCSPTLCDDHNACTQDACDAAGSCVNTAVANGSACSDGNACTQSDSCQAGACVGHNPVTCSASDACHVAGVCDPGSGTCSNVAAANGTACNDTNACTQSDSCQAGVCVGQNPVACAASDACHVAGVCNPSSGACSNPAAPNGTACNDANACTQSDSCQAGVCVGQSPVACAASDACHVAGVCDPASGACNNPPAPDGSACNDGNACTQSDKCLAGACAAGTAKLCTALDGCHPGVCDPGNGACSNPLACALYGVGSLSATLTDGLVVSPQTLEDGLSNNLVGGLGSAISYTGVGNLYVATPDRGPNNGFDSYTDRYYEIDISLAGGTVSPRIVGADALKREDGAVFTGFSAAFDATGSSSSLRLDPEGVRVSPQGTLYVSDEYGPYVYEFGNDGKRLRALAVPSKFLIAHPADANGNELPPINSSGRQTNRGMEGLALSPDGHKLYGLMQSALIQDGALNGSNSRIGLNNRMLEIDTGTGATREFLYPMENKSYGLNELLAVNDHQFLVIERDGDGGTSAAFKKLFLIDISAATDISAVASLPSSGAPAGVTPVTKTLFLDLLSSDYGLAGASFPEKIEGLTFGPDLPDGRHTLIVTNDNDFLGASGNADNFYVFALSSSALPGFVSPQHTFSSVCDTATCTAASACYQAGSCDPSSGTCSTPTVASGTPVGIQTAGDCQKQQCDGAGNIVVAADNDDVPADDGNPCTSEDCVSGTPTHTALAAGTLCSQSGGSVCDGMGGCVSCLTASDCAGSDTECAFRTCDAGTCGIGYASAGTPTASQVPGDCDVVQCDGSGGVLSVVDDTDVPDDKNPCTNDVCTNGVAVNLPTSAGSSCGGANVCDGAGQCTGCVTGRNCPGVDSECAQRTCTAGTCGFSYTAAGTPVTTQISGDCQRNECDGAGNVVVANDSADVPADDGNPCTTEACAAGTPTHPNGSFGTLCAQNGGQICDGNGACIAPTLRVVRVQPTSGNLTSAATPVFVDEYSQSGSLVGSVALPTAASGANRVLTQSGTASAEGGLSRSANGQYLALAGYDAVPGTTGVASTTVATVNRIVGRIDATSSGNVDTTTRFTTAFDANNVRGATTNDGTGFWAAGAGGTSKGVWYLPLAGSGGVQVYATQAARWPSVVSGQLYCSSDKGPNLFTIGSGLPTTAGQTGTTLPGYPSSASGQSPFGYALLDLNPSVAGVDTLYVADDTTGGIKKWTYNGSTWTQATSTFTKNGSTATNFRGLIAVASSTSTQSAGVTLIAGTADTNGSNNLVKFVDNGTAGQSGTAIVTLDGTTKVFRGLALSPHGP